MNVPLLDLKAQYATIREELRPLLEDLYDSQHFILGPHVERLEREMADYCGAGAAVGVSSGSDALIISLMAAGIEAGDRVLTTPFTFFATAGAIARVGARPVFADIQPDTYNLDPAAVAATIEAMAPGERQTLKAVIPVHLYGQCADMDPIEKIADTFGLRVIEDAAQAIGAEYKGRRAGSLGDYGCFSFFPSKNLGAFGDGGMVTTTDGERRHELVILRGHGAEPKYYHQRIGGNFRLDALQAVVLSVKLTYLDEWSRGRQQNADRYRRLIGEAGLGERIMPPAAGRDRHIYNQFVIRVPRRRDELRDFLTEKGIGTEIYYPVPLHLQACFADLGYRRGDFPVAESAAEQTLALPIFPELTDSQLQYVIGSIDDFFKQR